MKVLGWTHMACSACPLPVLGNGGPGPGDGVLPGTWKERATHRRGPKAESALLHFKAVLSSLSVVLFTS